MWTDDPVHDAAQYDLDVAAEEKECPVCEYCGEAITDETYMEIEWGVRLGRYHKDCSDDFIHIQYLSDYIRDRRAMQC